MSVFGPNNGSVIKESEEVTLVQALVESELMSYFGYEELQEFVASDECEALCEAGLINRKTIIRLNRMDDLQRRTKIAAMQIARDKKDPVWEKLVKNREKEREYLATIMQKYANQGSRDAKSAQREFQKSPTLKKIANTFGHNEEDK